MVSSKKRGRQEMEDVEPQEERSMIEHIRNMWEFANLAQWIYIFGKAVKIDEELDIEDLEMECMKSNSTVLADIGLSLLKFVSSHRGLTPEIFDEYTRRQYLAKAPQRNPFGSEEEPAKFTDFDSFTKIRVLQQLTQWTMINPDRIRERMDEQKDGDQTYWRIEPFGWDSEDRTYIVLDDNRLYRQTAPAPPPPAPAPPKKNSKKAKAALRASKRRKVSALEVSDEDILSESLIEHKDEVQEGDDGLGGTKWECLAITLDDLNRFVSSIERSRDPNEKVLRARITADLLPLLEKQEEARKRKAAQKERELLNLEKLATAKRSSRIAGKVELQRQEEETREAERKKQLELAMAKKEQEKWMKLEKERESRMMTREQRLKEREARRILHEEELAGLSEDSKKLEAGESRLSERHLKAEIEKRKLALEELAEEDDWVFDCICGAYGQVDDGSHSISCEKCNIWQHTKCVGMSEAAANRDDFHFICKTCRRRAEEEEKAKHRPTIKLKFTRPGSSSSSVPPPQPNGLPLNTSPFITNGAQSPTKSSDEASSAVQFSPSKLEYESPYSNSWKLSFKPHSPSSNGSYVTPSVPKVEKRLTSHGQPDSTQLSSSVNRPSPYPNTLTNPYTNGGHAISPVHPYSPTSLPPPSPHRDYPLTNGAGSSNASSSHTLPLPYSVYSHLPSYQLPAPIIHTAQTPRNGGYSLPLVETESNKISLSERPNLPVARVEESSSVRRQIQQEDSEVLRSPRIADTVSTKIPLIGEDGTSSSLITEPSSTGQLPVKSLLAESTSIPSPIVDLDRSALNPKSSYASAFIPATTGISPIKHSPPRLINGSGFTNLTSTTLSVLPPVASLAPSPQLPNSTPPVKSAEPVKQKLLSSPLQSISSTGIENSKSSTPSVTTSISQSALLLSPMVERPNLAPPAKAGEPEYLKQSAPHLHPSIVEGVAVSNTVMPSVLHPIGTPSLGRLHSEHILPEKSPKPQEEVMNSRSPAP